MNNAIVTLDVLHPGVLWGWYVTMNFWAKSVATGVILLAPWLLRRGDNPGLKLKIPAIAFIFINITLLFTLLDLHQPTRFYHMFLYPNFRSAINIGSWILSGFAGLTFLQTALGYMKRDELYKKLMSLTWIFAFLATIYTAALLGQANAREIWHAATEVPQLILTALLAGSATIMLVGKLGKESLKQMSTVFGLSGMVGLTMFLAEIVLAPMKSEEAEILIHMLTTGEYSGFFLGGIALAFVIPIIAVLVARKTDNSAILMVASVLSLVGLWLVKHAWLIVPQLIPLS